MCASSTGSETRETAERYAAETEINHPIFKPQLYVTPSLFFDPYPKRSIEKRNLDERHDVNGALRLIDTMYSRRIL